VLDSLVFRYHKGNAAFLYQSSHQATDCVF
jgi:hypothetical protein